MDECSWFPTSVCALLSWSVHMTSIETRFRDLQRRALAARVPCLPEIRIMLAEATSIAAVIVTAMGFSSMPAERRARFRAIRDDLRFILFNLLNYGNLHISQEFRVMLTRIAKGSTEYEAYRRAAESTVRDWRMFIMLLVAKPGADDFALDDGIAAELVHIDAFLTDALDVYARPATKT